ncbi:thiol:disulfide interchange protein DsbA/DsbL [Paraferrimonas sedimenticola]|uniref:Thiol:disulfide interchange protein n=1 Tax=Paraferrimonas sedimenticola TaxID=375674 RepID=A0AA37RZP0_9GAMM|nr:thiol:disulfide interchange protein DsbA/DsbL [Paraferrimonas sedimenticola]GLP97582.1 thiol:disulfide interchange protein [Paraferrimonas sedimenticola]
MKKLMACALALMLTPLAALADFKEGVNYEVINQGEGSAKPTVTEYFSFFCGHCNTFEKGYVPRLKGELKDADVVFKQNHVDFIGREMGVAMTKAYAIAIQLGVTEKVKPVLFSRIHDEKKAPRTPKEIRDVFIATGVNPADYDKAAESFMVKTMASQMARSTQNAKLTGVPTFVVNDKYRVNTQSVKSFDELSELILYLTQKD